MSLADWAAMIEDQRRELSFKDYCQSLLDDPSVTFEEFDRRQLAEQERRDGLLGRENRHIR